MEDKIVILADKNVAKFLRRLDKPIEGNEQLFILDTELGLLIQNLINEKGLESVVKRLKEGEHEEGKDIKKSFF